MRKTGAFFALALLCLAAGCGSSVAPNTESKAEGSIRVLSNRADLISGGDALVEIAPRARKVMLNGVDVTSMFGTRGNGRYMGLLTNLELGQNELVAELGDGRNAEIAITNHPNGGPVFSGPQILPWPCNTPGALDDQCNHPLKVEYLYRADNVLACGGRAPCFAAYDLSNPPASVPTTTTDQGKTVPYIVRLETGFQDRDKYQIAVLDDPLRADVVGYNPPAAWNHKVLVTQGAGCGNHYGEGTEPGSMNLTGNEPGDVLVDKAISRGFAVMSTALTNSNHNCNLAVQAESVMMAKERLVEALGEIRYTIAQGCSGGSLSQYQVANAYPGLYQGLLPDCTFPDAWTTAMSPYDCFLLNNYLLNPVLWRPGLLWTPAQQAAVSGSQTISVCATWTKLFVFYPTLYPHKIELLDGGLLDLQNCGLKAGETFDLDANPNGVRCGAADHQRNIMGFRPDGYANRPIDNVGVQYGLRALEAGTISPAQFVDLNAKVGSRDINWVQQPGRTAADIPGLVNAYRSGAINEATHLDQVAIIDLSAGNFDIHESWRAFAVRARMDAAYGHHDNHVIWYTNQTHPDPLLAMDDWLSRVEADSSDAPLSERIVTNKPAELVDMVDKKYFEGTRGAAGMPFPRDINKCSLKPLAKSDYPVEFTDDQWSELETTFPEGVCDWSKPGIGQQPTIPWMHYGTASEHVFGGAPLGPEPVSIIR